MRNTTENDPLLSRTTPFRLPSRASLIRRLERLLRSATWAWHVGYAVSVVLLFMFLAMFAFVEWVAQHFGIAIGEGVCFGAALVWLTRRYMEGRKFLKRARKTISHPKLDDDLFDIINDALKKYVSRGMEAASVLISAYAAPWAIRAPDVVAGYFRINTEDGKVAIAAGVGVAAAGLVMVSMKVYDYVRTKSFELVDDIVDHVDDMPQFDWLDHISGDEIDPANDERNVLNDSSDTIGNV